MTATIESLDGFVVLRRRRRRLQDSNKTYPPSDLLRNNNDPYDRLVRASERAQLGLTRSSAARRAAYRIGLHYASGCHFGRPFVCVATYGLLCAVLRVKASRRCSPEQRRL